MVRIILAKLSQDVLFYVLSLQAKTSFQILAILKAFKSINQFILWKKILKMFSQDWVRLMTPVFFLAILAL